MKRLLFSLLLFSSLLPAAQQPSRSTSAPAPASVRFSFDWSQGYPWTKYTITVESNGKAHFDGTMQPDATNDNSPHEQDFTISEANRQKIFELAERLNYFRGNFDSRLKHIAKTGTKTLQYESPDAKGSTSYNWSTDSDIQELTRVFQGIATTIDYGGKLQFQYRFDKLGMNQRMEELQKLQAGHQVEELGIIAPILRKIADDPNIMNITRGIAQRLLRSINAAGAGKELTPAAH